MSRSLLSIFILLALVTAACAPRVQATVPLGPPALLLREVGSGLLYPVDPSNGEALPGYQPVQTGTAYIQAISPPAGHRLAFLTEGGELTLVDLPAWEQRTDKLDLPRPVYLAAFSPDGERLAVVGGRRVSSLALVDLAQMQVTGEASLDFLVHQVRFTQDGSGLMVYGTAIEGRFTVNEMSPGPPRAALLDGTGLSLLWSEALEGVQHGVVPKDGKLQAGVDLHQPGRALYMNPGLAFAPDRDALYVAHAGQDLLTVVDFSARQVVSHEIHERLSWLERLLSLGAGRARGKIAEGTYLEAAISPDGRRLYVAGSSSILEQLQGGDWEVEHISHGVQVIDTSSGRRLAWHPSEAGSPAVSPDGANLYLRGWGEAEPWTEVLDTASGKMVTRLEGVYAGPVRGLDGRTRLVSTVGSSGNRYRVTVLDPDSLDQVGEWECVCTFTR